VRSGPGEARTILLLHVITTVLGPLNILLWYVPSSMYIWSSVPRKKNSIPQWGAESSLAGQWLPAAGGDGAWAARTGSGPMRMCCDIFTAARLWRGRLLTTGRLSAHHPVVVGAGDVAWGSRRRGRRKRGRAPGAAQPSAL
jgi:hypothetical protein